MIENIKHPARDLASFRKADDWSVVDDCQLSAEKAALCADLPVLKIGEDVGTFDDLDKPAQIFIVERPDGRRYLVNTEGYSYARYIAGLPKAAPAVPGTIDVPTDLLVAIGEFIDKYVDVKDGESGPIPNEAMRLATQLEPILSKNLSRV